MLVERLGRAVTLKEIASGTCVAFSFGNTTYLGMKFEWQIGGETNEFVGSLYPADPDLKNVPGVYESSVFSHSPLYELPNVRVSLPISLTEVGVHPADFPRTPGLMYLTEKQELALVLRYADRNLSVNVKSGKYIQSSPPLVWFPKWQVVYGEADRCEVICTFEVRKKS